MNNRILVLSAHTDDAELGCGGTIAKLAEGGDDIVHLAFSSVVKEKRPQHESPNIYELECTEAGGLLGIKEVITYDFNMREFPEQRQQILDRLVWWRNNFAPITVLLPSTFDTHQDHQTLREEGFRAFKNSSMLGYELPWNNLTFQTTCFVPLTNAQFEKKVNAVKCYKSQIGHYHYFSDDFVQSLARTRGTQIGVRYAESLEVIRWVM